MLRRGWLWGVVLLVVGCQATDSSAPCSTDGECLPGFVCRFNFCVAGGDAGRVGNCGVDGCEIDGPALTQLIVPRGSLSADMTISIEIASAGVQPAGLQPLSGIYLLTPSGLQMQVPARVVIPLDPGLGVPVADIAVWSATNANGPWTPLTGSSTIGAAVGDTSNLGFITAARR